MDATEGYVDGWTWEFGDGGVSYGPNTVHDFDFAGIDTVRLTVSSFGCLFQARAVVAHGGVNDACLSDIHSDFLHGSGSNNTVEFTDQSLGDGSPLIHFWWFGDDSISLAEDPIHFYTLPGAYDVTHSIATLDSLFQTACVAGSLERVLVDGNTSTCDSSLFLDLSVSDQQGQTTFDAQAIAFSGSLQIQDWLWDYGDGVTSTTTYPGTAHDYPYPGDYQVCVHVTAFDSLAQSGCYARACTTVSIYATGLAERPDTKAISAFPNPFRDQVRVDGPDLQRGSIWELFDGLGRVVQHGTIDLPGTIKVRGEALDPGLYMLRTGVDHGGACVRLLKE